MDLSKFINIVVTKDTHKRLGDAGRKGDSYNDVIIKLLDNYEKNLVNTIDKNHQETTEL